MIEVSHLSFDYPGKRALWDISFRLSPQTITALVGPNGSGKTTLMRCLAALQYPAEGKIRVAGLDVFENPRAIHRKIGYLSDFFGLYDELTVKQCLLHRAAVQFAHKVDEESLAREAARRVNLDDRLMQKSRTLSRGLKQRLGIGMAIVHKPEILILDEPASGLDPDARIALSAMLRALRDEGMTLLVSSHILAELQDYSTHMMILREGRLVDFTALDGGAQENFIVMRLKIGSTSDDVREKILALEGLEIKDLQDGEAYLLVADEEGARADVLGKLIGAGIPVSEFAPARSSLQDQYLSKLYGSKSA